MLLMSVNPGFGGQSFIPRPWTSCAWCANASGAAGKAIRLEVDGGVKPENIGEIARAGADTFVAGSAIFGQPDYAKVIAAMKAAVAAARG